MVIELVRIQLKEKLIQMKYKIFVLTIVLLFSLLISTSLVQAATLSGTIYDYELEQVNNVLLEIDTVPAQQFLSQDGTYQFELTDGVYTLKASKGDLIAEEEISIIGEGSFVYDLFLFPSDNGEDDNFWDNVDDALGTGLDDNSKNNRLWAYLAAGGILLIAIGRIIIAKKKYPKHKKGKKSNNGKTVEVELHGGVNGNGSEPEEIEPRKEGKTVVIGIPEDTPSEPKKPLTREEKLASIEQELEQNETPGYIKRALDIIKANDGRISQKELRKEMMDLSESKVSLIITELEHKGKIEKVKRGRGNIILLKE